MRRASFTYHGGPGREDRLVTFSKRHDGQYTVQIEGMPALTIIHPSYNRVKAAFEGFYQMSQKDYGATDIDWGDMNQ